MPTKQWQPPAGDPVVSSWKPPAGDRLLSTPTLKSGPDTAEPAAPGSLQDILGMGANIGNNAMAGAGFGSMAGPVGTGVGAIAGGLSGLFQKPSDAPGADLGALAGSAAASLVPGGRLARGAAQVGGTLLGTYLGSRYGDRALGVTKDTDVGRMVFYGAGATVSGLLGAIARDFSPTAEAAARLKASTGADVPLSVSEGTGTGEGRLTGMFAPRADMRNLSQAQSAALKSAMGKIVDAPTEQWVDIINQAAKIHGDVNDIVSQTAKDYRAANAKVSTKQVPSGVLDANGQPILKTVSSVQSLPEDQAIPEAWNQLQAKLGWTDEERQMVFAAAHRNPEQFVNALAPGTGPNVSKGLFALRGIVDMLKLSGKQSDATLLGQAFVMRDLRPALQSEGVDGKTLANLIDNGVKHWSIVLGQKQIGALQDLATVARNADPLPKLNGTNATEKAAAYLNNKIMFGTASLAASGLMGHEGAAAVPTFLVAGAGGLSLVLGVASMVGKILADPATAKYLVAASHGNQSATGALIRSLSSSALNKGNTLPRPASRLAGFMAGTGGDQQQ